MKNCLAACCLLLSPLLFAQKFTDTGTIFISGKVTNAPKNYAEYSQTGFVDDRTSSFILGGDGTFKQAITIEGQTQDITFYLEDTGFTFTATAGDSIQLSWDATHFEQSFKARSRRPDADTILQGQWFLHQQIDHYFGGLQNALAQNKSLPAEEKFALINTAFNKEVEALSAAFPHHEATRQKLYTDLYYRYTHLLFSKRLLGQFALHYTASGNNPVDPGFAWQPQFKILNESTFWTHPLYRAFLFDYCRFAPQQLFTGVASLSPHRNNFPASAHYMGKSLLDIKSIRDWFLTQHLLLSFDSYNFLQAEAIYKEFRQELSDPFLKNKLEAGYTSSLTLKPGKPAPALALTNAKGQPVSLKDFAGKIVYLDFWATWYGPCIADIQANSRQLHQRYQGKDIAFISVCVGSEAGQWKEAIKKYDMSGSVNLYAPGGLDDPSVKAYQLNGVPRYILIDKNGKIINNNAPFMLELVMSTTNEIDEALAR
ncbi:TlpA family protein disulfide reductase [Niabella sp. CJ426]|uniref:TlpA family protein disulfide reductase n=1 Tax=Niabella sp. CJ426 TaxID=3393740 RepID=UPI003CFCEBF6